MIPQFERGDVTSNLSVLAEALEAQDDGRTDMDLAAFVSAAKDRTNVAEQRKTRFEYFLGALTA